MSPTATATRSSATAVRTAGPPRPRRRRVVVVVLIAAAVLLLSAGWLVLFASAFAAKQVAVTGVQDLSTEQVLQAAQVPLGRPLVRVDLEAIAERSAQLPQVESAQATRDWPGTIQLAIVERRPLLAVAQPSGFVLIDRTGLAYETRPAVPDGVLQAEVNPDDRGLMSELAVVAAALPETLRDQVSRVRATSSDNITLRLESGVVVGWGGASEASLKAEVVMAMLKRDPQVSIDVSSPHNPAVR